ncbi:hypothetical protein Nmel_014917, partial [Mimus melanotis]
MFSTAYLLHQALSEVNKHSDTLNIQLTPPHLHLGLPHRVPEPRSSDVQPLPRRD